MFDESLPLGEDELFLFVAYPCSAKTIFIPDKLYYYRLSREGSAMDSLFEKRQSASNGTTELLAGSFPSGRREALWDFALRSFWCGR